MRRRSRAGGEPVKTRSRKTAARKRGNAPKALRRSGSSAVGLSEQVALFKRERDEALEQQKATADVLRVISSSPGDLKPVFEAILENATRICEAKFGTLFLREGDTFTRVATHNAPPNYAAFIANEPLVDRRRSHSLDRLIETKQAVHVADMAVDEPEVPVTKFGRARTLVTVPMLKENELIGAIGIYRQEVRPFTDKQIALVQNFAAQAVIAIENTRLLNELRQSLQQQTATADVLKIISRSTFDLKTVLNTLAESAASLCEAYDSIIFLRQGERLHVGAHHGSVPMDISDWPIGPGWVTGRAFLDRAPVHIYDLQASAHEFPDGSEMARRQGTRTILAVPLLRADEAVGTIQLRRAEVYPFTDRQIELLTTFADQAAIAIENTRLFEAEQQRTRELSESLEQQTATSKVLEAISSSPGDLKPVFQAILENAVRLCGAKFGNLYLREGDGFRAAAMHNAPPAYAEKRTGILHPSPNSSTWKAIQTKKPAQTADVTKLQAYVEGDPWLLSAASLAGYRSALSVPMLHNDKSIGCININRQEVGLFADKQVELLTNFAKQAVIAIENTRLLNELRRSLEQQTATADVLKTISRSTFDLQTVLDTLVQSAARLCRADQSGIRLAKDGLYYNVASHGYSPEHKARMERETFKVDRSSVVGRVVLDAKSVHLIDSQADPNPELVNRSRSGNIRTLLGVPLQREGTPIGVLLLQRTIVQPFTDEEIGLAETFADQAVIAIENVRLFEAEQQRTRELSELLEQQTATSEVLRVISASPGELEPVFQAMLENATRLCEAQFGVLNLYENGALRMGAMHNVPSAFAEFLQSRPAGYQPMPNSLLARVMRTRQVCSSADTAAENVGARARALGGARSTVCVPMLKDDALIGTITIYRQEVQPFSDKQIELVRNFAAQAVIAIENTRLLNELRRSLEQQTATADVLKVISSSPGKLQPVFDAMLANATRICEASYCYRFSRGVTEPDGCSSPAPPDIAGGGSGVGSAQRRGQQKIVAQHTTVNADQAVVATGNATDPALLTASVEKPLRMISKAIEPESAGLGRKKNEHQPHAQGARSAEM